MNKHYKCVDLFSLQAGVCVSSNAWGLCVSGIDQYDQYLHSADIHFTQFIIHCRCGTSRQIQVIILDSSSIQLLSFLVGLCTCRTVA